ncbi:MAG: SulP family inorganic anion transporter [Clostridia bacterium]|nr:SulP family inorganic anion transporter [Clostridia bacterium]
MDTFQPKLISTLKDYSFKKFTNDFVAGLIVAIIALPLSIALAIASGVSPEKGLYTAIVAGFVIALLGGSRVNISGPTAAFATIVAGIVAQFGTSGLIIATIMAGIMLIVMGLCKFGSLIKYIPHTITTGFTSGIAVTICIGQLKDFLGLTFAEGTHAVETTEKLAAVAKSLGTINVTSAIVGLVALAILIVWPKISKKIPGSLIAVIAGVAIVKGFDLEVNTIGDLYQISGGLPRFELPGFSFGLVRDLLPSAFTIAVLAGVESLLSCVVSDNMIKDKHNSNTELIAQGVGNIFSGLFGGIPATGAIARTAANVKNGGKTPIAGIIHALVLLLVLVVLMPYAAWIPMPVIAAILFMVAYNMCEWRQFVDICKTAPKSDITVLVLTFILTVVFDLVVAIEFGLLAAAFLFIKRMVDVTYIRPWTYVDEKNVSEENRLKPVPPKTQVYEIDGPMFFATSDKIASIPIKRGIKIIILRMRNIPAIDASALRAIEGVYDYCQKRGITLLFSHVNEQPLAAMQKANFYEKVGEENFLENIDEALEYAEKLAND